MKSVQVDARLQRNYDAYYGPELTQWRELGAIDKINNIRQLCARLAPQTVIDIGAGEGAVLQGLSRSGLGRQHYALEISGSGVEQIRARGIPTLIEARQFDGYAVPYADGAFDLAVLSHVIEHVEHPRLLLNEAARVAAHVFVEVPLEHNRGLPHDFAWNPVGHINFYTAQTIRLLAQTCGHEVLAQIQSQPARAQYVYRMGPKGSLAWGLKELVLRASPRLAGHLWTYHSSLLLRSRWRVEADQARAAGGESPP